MSVSRLRTIAGIALGLRFLVLLLRAPLAFNLPEVWRQTDTLGVSLRYFSRWFLEPSAPHALLPAVLNSGDTPGLMAMEFPILNLVLAPSFALGPFAGKTLACALLVLLVFGLTLSNARLWRGKSICGVDAETVMLFLPVLSLGAEWSGKFMPDYLSFLFVTMAVGASWNRPRVASFFLAALGLLMKPTSLIVFFMAWDRGKKNLLWMGAATLGALAYYKIAVPYLISIQDLPLTYAVTLRPVGWNVVECFQNLGEVLKLVLTQTFFPYAIVLLLPVTLQDRKRVQSLWIVLIAQIAFIGAAGGLQSLTHRYYFIGITLPCAVIWVKVLLATRVRALTWILIAGFFIRLAELSHMDLRAYYVRPEPPHWQIPGECRALVDRNPKLPWRQGKVFRAAKSDFPELGVCFGEREGSTTAPYGFYWKKDTGPADCRLLDETENLKLVSCGGPGT